MKRVLLSFIICFLISGSQIWGEEKFTGPTTEPLPYEDVEFPAWSHDLRRFEVILFGSVPLTYILTNLIYNFSLYATHNFDSEYGMGTYTDQEDIQIKLMTSLSLSTGIAAADFVIGKIKESRAEKKPPLTQENRN